MSKSDYLDLSLRLGLSIKEAMLEEISTVLGIAESRSKKASKK